MDNFIVLNLGHARTIHRWTNHDISSPFVRLFYVTHGQAVMQLTNERIELKPGHMYMLPGYTPHAYDCEPDFDFYYLFVYQPNLEVVNIFDLYDFPYEVKANDAADLLFKNYCNLYPQLNLPSRDAEAFLNHQSYRYYAQEYMKMEEYERLQLHGLVEILLSYFVKYAQPKAMASDDRMTKLLDYVQQHINQTISVDELADKACLTKSYLIRAFRQSMGITPLQYIIRKKIQHAQKLLLGSDLTIQQVAEAVGFTDVSYFIRLFHKNIGFTPQAYRKKLIG